MAFSWPIVSPIQETCSSHFSVTCPDLRVAQLMQNRRVTHLRPIGNRESARVESGRPITGTTLLRICEVFEVSMEKLVRGLDSGSYESPDAEPALQNGQRKRAAEPTKLDGLSLLASPTTSFKRPVILSGGTDRKSVV